MFYGKVFKGFDVDSCLIGCGEAASKKVYFKNDFSSVFQDNDVGSACKNIVRSDFGSILPILYK